MSVNHRFVVFQFLIFESCHTQICIATTDSGIFPQSILAFGARWRGLEGPVTRFNKKSLRSACQT